MRRARRNAIHPGSKEAIAIANLGQSYRDERDSDLDEIESLEISAVHCASTHSPDSPKAYMDNDEGIGGISVTGNSISSSTRARRSINGTDNHQSKLTGNFAAESKSWTGDSHSPARGSSARADSKSAWTEQKKIGRGHK
jgi:hypothetical protein